jgi:vacuolar-type H+-ATPase subunit H
MSTVFFGSGGVDTEVKKCYNRIEIVKNLPGVLRPRAVGEERRNVDARSVSPLQVIKQKESDLRQRVEAAHRQAEAKIQAAREEAKQTIAQADQEGRAEANAFYQRGIQEAVHEAETIVAAAHEESVALRHQATARLNDAARWIVELVLIVDSPPR